MTTVDEYIKELQRELVNPKSYKIEGAYRYLGNENFYSGEFLIGEEISDKRQVVGEIIDYISVCKKHAVKGELRLENKLVKLDFIKIPTWILVPIYYSLIQSDNNMGDLSDESIRGMYEGHWAFVEKGIISKNLQIIGERRNNQIAISVVTEVGLPEQKNTTYLKVYK